MIAIACVQHCDCDCGCKCDRGCECDCEDEIKKRDVGHIVGCPMHCGVPTRCPIDKWHGGQPASPLSHCHSALQCHIMPFHTPRAILYHAMPYKTAPYHTEFHFIWNHHCHHCIVTVFCAEETDQNMWVQSQQAMWTKIPEYKNISFWSYI